MDTYISEHSKWMDWAKRANERRKGRSKILPEILGYLKKYPEDLSRSEMSIEESTYISAPDANPTTWESLSETLIDEYLENKIGPNYNSLSEIPNSELCRIAAGIVGQEIAGKFADYISTNGLVMKEENGLTIVKRGDEVILNRCLEETVGEVIVPNGITKIAFGAFINCKSVISVIFPDSLTSISFFAFANCPEIQYLSFPAGIKEIGFQMLSARLNVLDFRGEIPITNGTFEKCTIKELRVNTSRNNALIPSDILKALEGDVANKPGRIVYAKTRA